MGLDMNILRITKPCKDDSVIYDRVDIDGVILNEDEIKEPKFKQLAPYVQPLKIRSQHYDMDKIRSDYNLSEDSYISGLSYHGISISDRKTDKIIKISSRDVESKYTVERVETGYVCNSEEICYWRKAYDIQGWFHEHIEGGVENTGFYLLSGELLLKFNKVFQDDKIPAEAPDEEAALFYWEWY